MNTYENYELDEIKALEDEEQTEEKERFKINDIDTANWAFRKIKALKSRIREKENLAKKETERIERWKEKEINADEKTILFFQNLLIEYYISQKEKDDKFKLSTPYGTVKSRKQPAKWSFEDNTVESLKKAGLNKFIKISVTETIDKAELKKSLTVLNGKAATKDGEIIEGINIIDVPASITVSVDTD